MRDYDFSSIQPYATAYSVIADLFDAMQSGQIPAGEDAAATWLSSAPDGWIVRTAALLDAIEQVEDEDDPLSPGAAGLVIVFLMLIWEGVEEERLDDDAFMVVSARRLVVHVTLEMARRSGAAAFELRGPLLTDDPNQGRVQWKRRPTVSALVQLAAWKSRALQS